MLAQFQPTAASIALQSLLTSSENGKLSKCYSLGSLHVFSVFVSFPAPVLVLRKVIPLFRVLACSAMGYAFLLRS